MLQRHGTTLTAGLFLTLATLTATSACNRHPTQVSPGGICAQAVTWPDWRTLFTRFAKDRPFMHRFLYNGDDLWPKQINLCARGRNSLLDLALGPGVSFELGLIGPAWEAHVRSVAITNPFTTFAATLTGVEYRFVWPVITTSHLRRMHALASFLWGNGPVLTKDLALPVPLTSTFRTLTKESDPARLQKRWARRLLGAYLARTASAMTTMAALLPGGDVLPPPPVGRALDRALGEARLVLVKRYLKQVRAAAAGRDLLFPSDELWGAVRALTYTPVPGWDDPLSPWQLKVHAQAKKDTRLLERCALLDHVLSPTPATGVPKAYQDARAAFEAIKKRGNHWRERIAELLATAAYRTRFESLLETAPILLTGNFFYGTAHLEETTGGFTHAALILSLPHGLGAWQFERVLGFYYANPARGLKNSAVAEVLTLPREILSASRRYAILPQRILPPFRFRHGSTDAITFTNLYSHLKQHLPAGLSLGYGFIYGALHLLPHLPRNRQILSALVSTTKRGDFEYRQYGLGPLRRRTLHLVAKCR